MSIKSIDYFIRNEREEKFASLADSLAKGFTERAAKHDEERSFPFENFEELKNAGYLRTTLPRKYGGDEASLYEMVLMQERLAKGDGSTALAVGWHVGLMLSLRTQQTWPEDVYADFCKKVTENGEMLNSFATEPASGSPSRGGKPKTVARKTDDGWLITGRKTFSTLSPVLNYFIVSASIEGENHVGRFLVRKSDRVHIEETWNTLGMRATGSHDVVLDQAYAPKESLVELDELGKRRSSSDQGWLLHITACYIGIAYAARDFAVQYARDYHPPSLPGPIAELPHIQEKIGQMEAELITARTLLYSVADRWDQDPSGRPQLRNELGVAKYVAVNSAISIVDKAMRVVGGASLSKTLPLERMYRDVRAGLHNPPMDDAVITNLAQTALNSVEN